MDGGEDSFNLKELKQPFDERETAQYYLLLGFLQKENELLIKEKENLINMKEIEKIHDEDKKLDFRLDQK
jgi:hypothetical protein